MSIDISKGTLGDIKTRLSKLPAKREPSNKMRIGFLLGCRSNHKITISDVLIPKQKRTAVTATIPVNEAMKSLYKMMSSNQVCIGMGIYQPNMPVYMSATNQVLMDNMVESAGQPMVCILFNEKGKHLITYNNIKGR